MSANSDEFSLASLALQQLQQLASHTTAGRDLDQAESNQLVEALKHFPDKQPPLSERLVINELDVMKALSAKLKELDAKLKDEIRDPKILALYRRQTKEALEGADALDHGLSVFTRWVWGIGNALLNAGDVVTTVIGPDRAQIPRNLAPQFRSVTVLLQYLMTPTASKAQLTDISVQRTLMILPGTITYAIAIALDVYGSTGLTAASIASSLALLLVVIIASKQQPITEHRRMQLHLKKQAGDIERGQDVLDPSIGDTVEEVEQLKAIIIDVASELKLGHATSSQVTRVVAKINRLSSYVRAQMTGELVELKDNPDAREKRAFVGMGMFLVLGVVATTAKNPSVLASNVQWAAYYMFRLIESARAKAHRARDTKEIFTNAGALMIFALPLVSAPLMANGPNAFNDRNTLLACTVTLCLLNVLVIDKTGPAIIKTIEKANQLIGRVRNKEEIRIPQEWMESVQTLRASLEKASDPNVLADLLAACDLSEQSDRPELGSSGLEIKDVAQLDGAPNVIDLFSFIDKHRDTEFLRYFVRGEWKEGSPGWRRDVDLFFEPFDRFIFDCLKM
ncbi:hypothetical protein N183_35625 [Sinorhizobium sp. Sb3]|uniref:hypothetical protein n=1 Tax=Sinorhizobium sp. Sb3 TaxID=1358417 RepID=UPI00071E1707|nr:hypothetical protein [Sinorhizobium sp. Sb3]KSV63384.1 hypothetical protein N183_35625 [Sinorhizobium sp. Sb3]